MANSGPGATLHGKPGKGTFFFSLKHASGKYKTIHIKTIKNSIVLTII